MKRLFEVIKENKVYIFPWAILVSLTIIMAFGLTYAYFDFIVDNEGESSMRVTATDLNVTITNPTVSLGDLYPIYDDYKNSQANTFTFSMSNNSRKLSGCVDLYLTFNSISEALKSEHIKYELVNNTTNTTTTGDFSTVSDNRLLLKENETIPINNTYSYTLRIWFSFSTTENQTDVKGSMNAKITSVAYGGACAGTRVTTYTTASNQFTASNDGYYRIEIYKLAAANKYYYTSGEIFLASGEKLYVDISGSVANSNNVKCYIDESTGLCGTLSTQNADNSRIMYAVAATSNDVNRFVYISGYAGSNSPLYVNSSSEYSNNTLHPTGKFFLNGKAGMYDRGSVNENKVVITYLGKYQERVNTKLDNVRYIKDCVNGNTANAYNHWVEIQAIKNGVNVAYKKTVSGSTTDSLVVDGIISSSQFAGGSQQCVTVDLGKTYDLDEIAVWHYYGDGRTYYNNVTSVSSNNSTWIGVINKQEPETMFGKRVSAYGIDNEEEYISDGLILLYDGINNNGLSHSSNTTIWKDLSGNGNDGTLTNFSMTSTSGWVSNGLKFDGSNDYVVTSTGGTNFSTFINGTPFSYCATFNTGESLLSNWEGVMTNMKSWGAGGFNMQFGKMQKVGLGYGQYLTNNIVPDVNEKYNVCGVYDGTTMKLYINGEPGASNTYSIKAGEPTMQIGRFYYDGSLFTNGIIYNVLFYNKALNANEINENYLVAKSRFGL